MYSSNEHQDQQAGLAAADHMLGNPDASVTLVEYGDYQCSACIQAEPLTRHLVDAYGKHLRFVYRHFPLMETHLQAELAAEAAEAAAAQGEFWAMHHLLYSQPHTLDLPALTKHAQHIGLDMNRFNGEMADRIYTQRIQEHRRAGQRRGIHSTPSFFLNGTAVDVSFGFEKLKAAVQAAAATAPHATAKPP